MSCSDVCIDMDYGDDYAEFYRETLHTARKEHVCCECKERIAVGSRYAYAAGKNEGSFWSVKTCGTCYEIRRAFVCGSWVFGMLWESIREEVFPMWIDHSPIDCLAKLETLEARNVMRARYEDFLK